MTQDDDLSPEEYDYITKFLNRTGIFRMYQMDLSLRKTHLLLEFAFKGKVLFTIKVWKYKHF
jgi:hypothetical protein